MGAPQRVPPEDLEQARVWLRYANAVYYLDAAVRAPWGTAMSTLDGWAGTA